MALKHAATVVLPTGEVISYHYDDEHPETPYSTLGNGETAQDIRDRIDAVKSGKVKPTIPDLETLTALVVSKQDEERRASEAVATLEERHETLTEEHAELTTQVAELRAEVALDASEKSTARAEEAPTTP